MDVFSFTTIILFLFVIIGAYLLFTNSIEGRAKIVLIIVVLIVFIYIFINLPIFNSYSEATSSPQTASKQVSLAKYDVATTSYSLSTWIYINDWSTNLGKSKIICQRSYPNAVHNPTIALDTNKNNLTIKFNTYQDLSQKAGTLQSISIPDIAIQKWVNIVTCFGDNKVDTYINGKLVNTFVTQFPQYLPKMDAALVPPIIWTPTNQSFAGYISNSRYYARFLSPQEVWEIYKGGFSNNMLGNFLSQYNATFVFSKNQTPIQTINIM
jgi:hypothetical protein